MENIFSQRLKAVIKEKDIKVNIMAESLGISPKTIYAFTKGSIFPSVENLVKISDYLNVSTDYLLGKSDDPTGIVLEGSEEPIKEEILIIRRAYQKMTPKERALLRSVIKGMTEASPDET